MSNCVHIASTGETFTVKAEESILEAASRAGIRLPHECTFGGCGTCRVKIRDGAVNYDEFPMALTDEEHEQGYALACQARPLGDLVIEPAAKGMVFMSPIVTQARVYSIARLTDDIVRLVLSLQDTIELDYRPGQYMSIEMPEGGTRSFSMASASLPDNQVDFHIRQIPGGHFTSRVLPSLRPGDTLNVEIPLGTFCHRPDDWRPMILAATGTGLAPVKAILESLLDSDECPPVQLYWGMRTEADLYAKDEIAAWAGRLYEFEFVPVLSQGSSGWTGRRGYVQDAIIRDHRDLSEHAFYLCGAPAMVNQAKQLFVAQGAELDFIYSDSFTFQSHVPVAA